MKLVDPVRSQPIRAVILRSAICALGGDGATDQELTTSLELQGFTAAWMPGDHGLSLVIGGGQLNDVQLEPSLTVIVPPGRTQELAKTITRPRRPNEMEWLQSHPNMSDPDSNVFLEDEETQSKVAKKPRSDDKPEFRRAVPGCTIGKGSLCRRPGWSQVVLGGSAWVEAFKIDLNQSPYPGRPFVIDIDTNGHRFQVYLTPDEVVDLKLVLRYVPSWFSQEHR